MIFLVNREPNKPNQHNKLNKPIFSIIKQIYPQYLLRSCLRPLQPNNLLPNSQREPLRSIGKRESKLPEDPSLIRMSFERLEFCNKLINTRSCHVIDEDARLDACDCCSNFFIRKNRGYFGLRWQILLYL